MGEIALRAEQAEEFRSLQEFYKQRGLRAEQVALSFGAQLLRRRRTTVKMVPEIEEHEPFYINLQPTAEGIYAAEHVEGRVYVELHFGEGDDETAAWENHVAAKVAEMLDTSAIRAVATLMYVQTLTMGGDNNCTIE